MTDERVINITGLPGVPSKATVESIGDHEAASLKIGKLDIFVGFGFKDDQEVFLPPVMFQAIKAVPEFTIILQSGKQVVCKVEVIGEGETESVFIRIGNDAIPVTVVGKGMVPEIYLDEHWEEVFQEE